MSTLELPPDEVTINPAEDLTPVESSLDREAARLAVQEYTKKFTAARLRHKATLDEHSGLKLNDKERRQENWARAQERMDGLLENLYDTLPPESQNDDVAMSLKIENLVRSSRRAKKQQFDPMQAIGPGTVRVQLINEPVPEYHDEWILAVNPDQDIAKGRKI